MKQQNIFAFAKCGQSQGSWGSRSRSSQHLLTLIEFRSSSPDFESVNSHRKRGGRGRDPLSVVDVRSSDRPDSYAPGFWKQSQQSQGLLGDLCNCHGFWILGSSCSLNNVNHDKKLCWLGSPSSQLSSFVEGSQRSSSRSRSSQLSPLLHPRI